VSQAVIDLVASSLDANNAEREDRDRSADRYREPLTLRRVHHRGGQNGSHEKTAEVGAPVDVQARDEPDDDVERDDEQQALNLEP
jgi:hypothetical protein